MHPLLIASIFVVAMASPAIVAVKYAAKPRKQLALASHPARSGFTRSDEGSVVLPVRLQDSIPAKPGLRQQETAKTGKQAKQQQASALDRQVDDVIRRLILMN